MSHLFSWMPDWLLETASTPSSSQSSASSSLHRTAILTRAWIARGRLHVTAESGRTCLSPEVLLVGVLSGLVAATCFVWGLLEPQTRIDPGQELAWRWLIIGFSLGFLVMAIYARHVWEWDSAGLRWRGALRSEELNWTALARVGRAWDGQFVAADTRGAKIRWSTYTLQREAMEAAIRTHRPDLRSFGESIRCRTPSAPSKRSGASEITSA